jgi:hypothetical protein
MTVDIDGGASWVPAACTLPTPAQPLRVAEFDDLFRSSVTRIARPRADRLVLYLRADDPQALRATISDLTRRETSCCSFFGFTLAGGDDAMQLEVTVPTGHVAVLNALAGRAAQLASTPS